MIVKKVVDAVWMIKKIKDATAKTRHVQDTYKTRTDTKNMLKSIDLYFSKLKQKEITQAEQLYEVMFEPHKAIMNENNMFIWRICV